jgi:hypothetical protein
MPGEPSTPEFATGPDILRFCVISLILSRIGAWRGLAVASLHFLWQMIERGGHAFIFSGPFQKLPDSGVALVRDRTN